jgi:putative hydrolase of HD superfamily
MISMSEPSVSLEFLFKVGTLKKIKRSGWIKNGIAQAESVADHLYRSALLAMVAGDILGLDSGKMVKIALLDDLAEAMTGDWMPEEQVAMGDEERKARERQAIERILSDLPDQLKKEYFSLWQEGQEERTPESKLCRQVDKLEMLIQALEYEREFSRTLDEFWSFVRPRLTEPLLVELFNQAEKMRRER